MLCLESWTVEKRRLCSYGRHRTTGVESIPLEPDQRSDLRREAPVSPVYQAPLKEELKQGLLTISWFILRLG